jgi:hypothetical protein
MQGWADVTARYAGYGQQDYQGQPWMWTGYGDALYPFAPAAQNRALMPGPGPLVSQLTQEKKVSAAAQATADITSLPGGKVGQPLPTIVDGSATFGNSAIVAATLVASTPVLINTYTVQVGYTVLLDNEDPEQMVMVRPYDNTTTGAYIDCTVKVTVEKAANGDSDTVWQGSSIYFRPDQNFVAGDRFRARWNKKFEAKAGDLIRTYLIANATQPLVTVNNVNTRIGHVIRNWELLSS